MRRTLLLSPLLWTACFAAPPELDVPAPDPTAPAPDTAPPPTDGPTVVCEMSKFSFNQASGCVNDGWVEFCAVKGGAPVTNALRAIASDLDITEGDIGRAGCDAMTEYHVQKPIQAGDCTAPHGALTDDAWGRLCALSQLDATKHFVPGFAE
jgi:hypothetical protein